MAGKEVIMKIFIKLSIMLFLLLFSVPTVFAGGSDSVTNAYFSINVPDSWTYVESSNTPEAETTGYGPGNNIALTPNEFSDILLIPSFQKKSEKIIATFLQDIPYRIKNAPLESYVKYEINKFGILNITSQEYTTVGKEKSVRIYTNDSSYYPNTNIVLYLVMHDNEPYEISYFANPKNYEKYLPEFEKIVKSFRFVNIPSEIENSSENENESNTISNFSGANFTELSKKDPSDGDYPEELYDECVRVSGESLCDFLFRR